MASERTIPAFIEAKTKKGLMELMVAVQVRIHMKVHFFDIQQDVVAKTWVAWYEIPLAQKLEEDANGSKSSK